MKKVTITLDEKVTARARALAAAQGKSMSQFISGVLEREIGRGEEKTRPGTIEEFLHGPLRPLSDEDGRLPSRKEIFGERSDELLRRYQR